MSPATAAKELWPWLKKYTMAVTAISVTAAAIVAVMNAVGILEPYWIATHGYMRSEVKSSEIRMLELTRDNLQKQIDGLELRIKNNDTAPDVSKEIWVSQVVSLKSQLRFIETELRSRR